VANRKKILIIDDEIEFTKVLKLVLEEVGDYLVEIENISHNAYSTALRFKPDLIFLDVIMPGMEGPDVFQQIRTHDELTDVPVVFLTATITKDEVDKQNGVIGGRTFLAKPGTVNELISCIEENIISLS